MQTGERRRQRRYSDEARAAALAVLDANGGNLKRTAHESGIPESTLKRWRRDPEMAGGAALRAQTRETAANVYGSIRAKASALIDGALDFLTPAQLADDPKLMLAVNAVGGTADDKETRARGEPTERIAHEGLSPEEAVTAARNLRLLVGGKAKLA